MSLMLKPRQMDKRQTVNAIIKLFRAKIAHWQIDELDDTQIRTALLDCSSSEQMCALLYNLECLIQKKQHCFIKENSVFKFFGRSFKC